ncbi:hypothetical protein [Dactylosporangium sp. NPDC049140]|jgi:hypothetical protein|uniref:DUF6928 family protein n=1 Tax=Dactylosporangium sp. NPDC049140 TaxID=3155647 RepID=UPI0033D91F70
MGSKAAILAFSDGNLTEALRADPGPDAPVEELVRRAFPGYDVRRDPTEDSSLLDTYPPVDVTYATVRPAASVLLDRRLAFDYPTRLDAHLLGLGAGRRTILFGMHSVVDWLGFAVWDDGVLVRALSLSPDDGVLEDIGERYDFEGPFWAGEHPVPPDPDEGDYPLPFHPIELGDGAMRMLFGFGVQELDGDLDALAVRVQGFRVAPPA